MLGLQSVWSESVRSASSAMSSAQMRQHACGERERPRPDHHGSETQESRPRRSGCGSVRAGAFRTHCKSNQSTYTETPGAVRRSAEGGAIRTTHSHSVTVRHAGRSGFFSECSAFSSIVVRGPNNARDTMRAARPLAATLDQRLKRTSALRTQRLSTPVTALRAPRRALTIHQRGRHARPTAPQGRAHMPQLLTLFTACASLS